MTARRTCARQVVSAVLAFLTRGMPPLSCSTRRLTDRVHSLQVVSAVLAFLTRGRCAPGFGAQICFRHFKTPADYWSRGGEVELEVACARREKYVFPKSADGELTVLSGELLTGVADKAVYGRYGLVHAVQVRAWCSAFDAGLIE